MSTGENTNDFKENNIFVPTLCHKTQTSSFEELSTSTLNQSNVTNNHSQNDINHCVNKSKKNKTKKKKIFCIQCYNMNGKRKHLRLMRQFSCKYCNLMFCSSHRFMDEHNCSKADVAREQYRQELLKKNPGCVSEKITYI